MASCSGLVVVLFLAVVMGVTEGVVYKVGDSRGWTIMGSPNYTAWASSYSFHVGDIILFEYNKEFHNVLEVSEPDYNSCSTDSPIATYTTGKDSITITTAGVKFYICGFPGHCQAGQKVEIQSGNLHDASPAPSPHHQSPPSPPPTRSLPPSAEGPSGGPAPAPSMSNAASAGMGWLLALVMAIGAVAAAGIL